MIEPVFEAVQPSVVVEIGAGRGNNTVNVLEYCKRRSAVAHIIDPAPHFDVAAWQAKYGGTVVFHRKTSLEALDAVRDVDVVLVDGDHNWYTVYHELKLIEKRAADDDHCFPVVLTHDIGWPYGRRDLYYRPERVPVGYRHPFAKAGLRPGKVELVKKGGLNAGLQNALHEHGPRNGVRTAIEDFMSETRLDLKLVSIPGIYGIGLLCLESSLRCNERLSRIVDSFASAEFLFEQCERLEERRIREVIRGRELRRTLEATARRIEELEEQTSIPERAAPGLQVQLETTSSELHKLGDELRQAVKKRRRRVAEPR